MNIFLQFILRYRAVLVFVLLELICVWLIVRNNRYQSAAFFNSSNVVAGSINQSTNNVQEYFNLRESNEVLARENARLYEQLAQLKNQLKVADSAAFLADTTLMLDSAIAQYDFLPARVISNSVNRTKNFITLGKGTNDGVRPGMAVVGDNGIVGQVKSASGNYAVVISLLHTNLRVSGVIGQTGTFGSVHWNGADPQIAQLEYVARHNTVNQGDTVFTSSFNSVFPYGIPIGVIEEVSLSENATYYDINLKLMTNFASLPYVFVVENFNAIERDSLEQANQIIIE